MNYITTTNSSSFTSQDTHFSSSDYSVIVLENDDPLLRHKRATKRFLRHMSRHTNFRFMAGLVMDYKEKAVIVLFLLMYIWPWVFPQYAVEAAAAEVPVEPGVLPATEIREPDEVRWITVTAYSSTLDQTDSTPFHTATGEHVYWGGVAANSLTFDSRVRFPGYYDDKMFRVNDRMHKRFSDRMDIWFPTRAEAQAWGMRRIQVEIWYY